ncbi:MAG: hypothetical protein CO184_00260 [Candidatus Zambryskibacteria bacterium CG_4_9_14_3_um_filter_40_16]|uniref:D-alanyl-D-alanine carboxypeptidase-like core domain-containing protein n=1 Tax=Candidatus Zambryskibacteria bacterium CG_4_9_14_3_um_filter_40_16 TaxID=1975111 RepID=A0A2M7WV64_9BACT|nr:MAG: hypothetical protein CO184_00260 [Candidatus Zambryskibacteria bacterium CG_4_9_14_3_um_filter_40_16]
MIKIAEWLHKGKNRQTISIIIIFIAVLILGYGTLEYYKIQKELGSHIDGLSMSLASLDQKNIELKNTLTAERLKNDFFENQINGISSTVNRLQKLSETDKELLQKYSKVYFLNENYTPDNLSVINEQYLYEKNRNHQVHSQVLPYLTELLDTAKIDGIAIQIISSFRSFGEQSSLKNEYAVQYGSGANTFSADQGYSEHQLGTALDFTTPKTGTTFSKFKETDAYKWLLNNAYKFGFTLSYPEGNTFYQFEPWHWRFVGTTLSARLHEENKFFYDLEQRDIDSYLISIFN